MINSCLPGSYSGQVSIYQRINIRNLRANNHADKKKRIAKEEAQVMKKSLAMLLVAAVTLSASPVFAEGTAAVAAAATSGGNSNRVWFFVAIVLASAFGMAIAAVGCGFAQSNAIRSAVEGIARNPSASGKIFTTMLIGIAMIESLAIYALVIALILIFVNPFTALL